MPVFNVYWSKLLHFTVAGLYGDFNKTVLPMVEPNVRFGSLGLVEPFQIVIVKRINERLKGVY